MKERDASEGGRGGEKKGNTEPDYTQERRVSPHVWPPLCIRGGEGGCEDEGVERKRRRDRKTDGEEWTQWETKRGARNWNNNINFQSLDWVTASSLSAVMMTPHVIFTGVEDVVPPQITFILFNYTSQHQRSTSKGLLIQVALLQSRNTLNEFSEVKFRSYKNKMQLKESSKNTCWERNNSCIC